MVNFDRDEFKNMNTEERETFVSDLVLKNIKLKPEEIKYLTPQKRGDYVNSLIKTSDWLEDYEFEVLNNEEQKRYINRKRYLDKSALKNVDIDVMKVYLNRVVLSKAYLTDEEFDRIPNDELKKYYVFKKTTILNDAKLFPKELCFLSGDEQIEYLKNLKKIGFVPSPEDFPLLKPKAIRFYQTQKTINEIRSIVRSEIKNIF